MASVLETLVVKLEGEVTDLQRDLRAAERSLRNFERTGERANRNLLQGFRALRGGLAATGIALLTRRVGQYAVAADQAANRTRVFENTLKRQGIAVSSAEGAVQRLSDRFRVLPETVQDATTVLFRAGASVADVEQALTAAGASAAAQGTNIATAFNNVSIALATGRSELLESSGIITNFGTVYQDFAREVGKSTDELTQQEKVVAGIRAIYRETEPEIADVDVLLGGLSGRVAEAQTAWAGLTRELGELFVPAATAVVEAFNAITTAIAGAVAQLNAFFDIGNIETNFSDTLGGAAALAQGRGNVVSQVQARVDRGELTQAAADAIISAYDERLQAELNRGVAQQQAARAAAPTGAVVTPAGVVRTRPGVTPRAVPQAEDQRTVAALAQTLRFGTEDLREQATRQFELMTGAVDLLNTNMQVIVRDLETITIGGGGGGGRLIAPAAFRPAPPRVLEPFTPVPALPPTPRPALPGGLPGGFIPGPVGGISSPQIRQRAPLEPIPFEDILAIQNSINAAGAALTTAIQGVADNVEAATTPLAVAADNLDRIRIAEPGAAIPALPGITPALPGFAPGSQLTTAQQGIISGTVTPTGAVKVNVENLGTISGAAGRALLEPRGQPLTLGELVAQFGPIREPRAVPRGREIPEEQAEIIQEQRAAAEEFREKIAQAGVDFAGSLAQSIISGDIGQASQGLFSSLGQLAGGLLPGPLGILASGGLGILGGIFGSIFGRRREEESAASRAASRTPPSLEFNFTVNQTNSLGGITDPQTTVRLNELTNDVLRQGEELIRRTVLPRLQALETATGLDNV